MITLTLILSSRLKIGLPSGQTPMLFFSEQKPDSGQRALCFWRLHKSSVRGAVGVSDTLQGL